MKKELVFFHKKEKPKTNIICQVDSVSKEFELSSVELELISHLIEAGKVFIDEQTLPRASTVISDINIAINMPSLYISRVVKFCQHFSAFTCLSNNDKISIVKGFFTECVNTRMSFNFEEENDGVLLYENESATKSILLQIFRFTDVHENDRKKFRNFHSLLKTELENDSTLRELVIVNFLFDKRNVTFPEHLRFQYFIYSNLLFRYLVYKYQNETRAKAKHDILINLMAEFVYINFKIHELHGKIDPIMQSPVVHELFNLL